MILSDSEIFEFIKHPANKEIIERGCMLAQQHIRHVKGIGIEDFFNANEVKGYENEEDKLLRHKISRATTVPIFASALGTIDKVFSASGYSCYYVFKNQNEELEKQLKTYLSGDIGEGLNMSGWMQQVWGDKINYDFNGVLMVELPSMEDIADGEGKQNEPYIIFKSIHDIHDYDVDGMNVEYIILHTECPHDDSINLQQKDNSIEYFRVVDDARDLIVRVEKGTGGDGKADYENFTILDTPQYPIIENLWGYVPATIISNQRDSCSEARTSFIWEAMGTADEYLLDSSIANISKKKHGFPQRWGYEIKCKMCDGAGKFPIYGDYENGNRPILNYRKCSDCTNGSIAPSPSISVQKPMPDAQNPDIGEPFGWVTPDIDSMKFQVEDMARLEKVIHESIWTVIDAQQTQVVGDKTATASVLDVSAKQTKLNKISNNGEQVEQFLTNAIGRAIFPDSFDSSVVKWGRKYYILSENELEAMYKAAKDSGVNASILKSYLEELIYVRYSTDPMELQRQLKLFEVEPFAHMTVQEVQSLAYCAISDKFLKTYFNDYIEEIGRTPEGASLIMLGTAQQLSDKLNELNKLKMAEAKAQEPPPDPPLKQNLPN